MAIQQLNLLPDALKVLRTAHGLTMRQLADRTNISVSQIADCERGRYSASIKILKAYSYFFEVPASKILIFAEKIGSIKSKKLGELDEKRQILFELFNCFDRQYY